MHRSKKLGSAMAAGCSAVTLLLTPLAGEAQAVKMRVADYLPVGHHFSKNGIKTWMERVTERTNGAVTFEHFPSEQLGKAKDLLSLTLSGVADVGLVAPSYVSDKMPLSSVAELPGGFSTSCAGTRAYWKLATSGLLSKDEFSPNGIRLLLTFVNPPYQILTSKAKIENATSFQGLKLRSTGGAMDVMVRKLSGVPVRMAGPEVYDGLSRATLDGIVFPIPAVLVYDLQTLVRQSTIGENFGSTVLNYVISEQKWRQLTPDVQRILVEEGKAASERNCAAVDADQEAAIERLRKAGVQMVTLPPAARSEIAATLGTVGTEWAADLDRRGKPGSQVLKDFRATVSQQ